MKKLLLAILIAIPFSILTTNAQVCGCGYRTFHIFVRDGLNTVKPRYELYAVMPNGLSDDYQTTAAYLSKTFFPNSTASSSRFWIYEPILVKTDIAERFLKGYDGVAYKDDPDERWFQENKYTGAIKFSELRFNTRELYDRPMLLKIFADNYKPVYLLGDHFGGCSKTFNVLLEEYLLESQRPLTKPLKR